MMYIKICSAIGEVHQLLCSSVSLYPHHSVAALKYLVTAQIFCSATWAERILTAAVMIIWLRAWRVGILLMTCLSLMRRKHSIESVSNLIKWRLCWVMPAMQPNCIVLMVNSLFKNLCILVHNRRFHVHEKLLRGWINCLWTFV